MPELPAGYRGRAARVEDVPVILGLVAACERELYGCVEIDRGGIEADLARPGMELAADTLLVHDTQGRPAARAWVDRRSEVDVHPEHRGRGLGAALLDWAEARARQTGTPRIVQTVPDGDAGGVALVRSRGYGPLVRAWLLEFAMPEEPGLPEPPDGVTVRPFRPGDGPAVHRLTEDAFAEWQPRRKAYEEWARHTVERPTFAPGMSPLAFVDGRVVGAVLSLDLPDTEDGYIERVAVHADHRNRGIARVLLRHAFLAFHRAGRRSCTLWTHSGTGALGLYERVGMTVRRSATTFVKDLTEGTGGPPPQD
ncbi:GNAT family N-acetyltransferase [Kitasatospora sp. DSM 101779]|uniref:GNAT family N-acetyltransferase n=1 Tax=Kitasatospora sp. DSM 101779 TaxID=2853165 RepID=UPI0021D7F90A|nr:GNAT family N-acetyltransferase [Kitasatospora sp. DSM 101779]